MTSKQNLAAYLVKLYGREAVAKALQAHTFKKPALPALQAHQMPPELDGKDGWLFLAGRGAGKSWAGAHWLLSQPGEYKRIIAPTFDIARSVCLEGDSGLLNVGKDYVKKYNRATGEVWLKDGTYIKIFSAEKPDRLRGSQSYADWMEEISSWSYGEESYAMARYGLRLGTAPKFVATTTPLPIKLIKDLISDEAIAITRAETSSNQHLSDAFVKSIYSKYGDSLLGRQELAGELIEAVTGALWRFEMFETTRLNVADLDQMQRVVVAVDPKASDAGSASETGIVVVAKGKDGRGYVLADYSSTGGPTEWASAVNAGYQRFKADAVIAEKNQGGAMVEAVLRGANAALPIKLVTATRGKLTRAEPVAALYERALISHVGVFRDLESQLATWKPGDRSPDRLDALVWGFTELFLTEDEPDTTYIYNYQEKQRATSRRR
jgi:phage terminase large subunit-like protein